MYISIERNESRDVIDIFDKIASSNRLLQARASNEAYFQLIESKPTRSQSSDGEFEILIKVQLPAKKRNNSSDQIKKKNQENAELVSCKDNKMEELEKAMERTIKCEKTIMSGQAVLKFEYYVSKAMIVAIKKFFSKKAYQRELANYNKLLNVLPQLVTKLISSDDKNLILISEKGFCTLRKFLFFYIQQKVKNAGSKVVRLIRQLAYVMLNIINSFNLNGIMHCDIKPDNIILNYKYIVGEKFLILKMIDLGYSINFNSAKTKNNDYMKQDGSTMGYTNESLLNLQTKEAILAAEFWCLGNIILEIIEIFLKKENLKSRNSDHYNDEIRPKIVKEIPESIIFLLDTLFSKNVLLEIDKIIKRIKNDLEKKDGLLNSTLYNPEHGYLIEIENLNNFIDEIYELNPLFQNFPEKTTEDLYKKAFFYTKVKPNSEKKIKEGKMIFLKCLETMKDVSNECGSKCLFHLGNYFHQSLRKYQFCNKMIKNYSSFSKCFPNDFQNEKIKINFENFVKRIKIMEQLIY